jgi:hypothetical protein
MKNTKLLVVAVMAMSMILPAAFAQSGEARTTVPFAFTVGNTVMPAGEYRVSSVGERFVIIENLEGLGVQLVLDRPVTKLNAQEPKLVFHKYGDKFFLSQAWLSYSETGHEFAVSSEEKKTLRAKTDTQQLTLVALNK